MSKIVKTAKTTKKTRTSTRRPYVIVRGDRSGVYFGQFVKESPDGRQVTLANVQQIWNWQGALNTVDLAAKGITGGKITSPAAEGTINDALGHWQCSPEAVTKIQAVKPWQA